MSDDSCKANLSASSFTAQGRLMLMRRVIKTMAISGSKKNKVDERHSRILSAAVEVFSRSSFGAASTEEIARRARVSKRDLYTAFGDKHGILTEVIKTVLEEGDANLRRAISENRHRLLSINVTLETIGLILVREILSPRGGFVCRLAFSENACRPSIGRSYFEIWYSRRNEVLTQTLSRAFGKAHRSSPAPSEKDVAQASRHLLALITHLPQLSVSLGITGMWTPRTLQTHVKNSVECFLRAYPSLL